MIVLGAVGSTLAARTVARGDGQKAQRAFAASSADVVSTLRLAIQHEQDLVVNTNAFWVSNPGMSSAAFNKWVQADHVIERVPRTARSGNARDRPALAGRRICGRASKGRAGVLGPGGSFRSRRLASGRSIASPKSVPVRSPASAPLPAPTIARAPPGPCSSGPRLCPGNLLSRPTREDRHARCGSPGLPRRRHTVDRSCTPRRVHRLGRRRAPTEVVLRKRSQGTGPLRRPFASRGAPGRLRSVAARRRAAHRPSPRTCTTVRTVETSAAVAAGGVFANSNAFVVLAGGTLLSLLLGLLTAVLATGRRVPTDW